METETMPVGRQIRDKIIEKKLKNDYVIYEMQQAGFEMNDVKFSNKVYGVRNSFTPEEVKVISKILKTNF